MIRNVNKDLEQGNTTLQRTTIDLRKLTQTQAQTIVNLKSKLAQAPKRACDLCINATIKKLKTVKRKNGQGPSYECPVCGKRVSRLDLLKEHMRSTHGEIRRRIPCTQCDKTFATKGTLRKHITIVHDGILAFACPEPGCAYRCKSRSILAPHIAATHRNLELFECHKCTSKFRKQEALVGHLKRHHGADGLAIPCIICDERCASRHNLRVHVRRVHASDYVPQCEICGEPFLTRIDRKLHTFVCGLRTEHEQQAKDLRLKELGGLSTKEPREWRMLRQSPNSDASQNKALTKAKTIPRRQGDSNRDERQQRSLGSVKAGKSFESDAMQCVTPTSDAVQVAESDDGILSQSAQRDIGKSTKPKIELKVDQECGQGGELGGLQNGELDSLQSDEHDGLQNDELHILQSDEPAKVAQFVPSRTSNIDNGADRDSIEVVPHKNPKESSQLSITSSTEDNEENQIAVFVVGDVIDEASISSEEHRDMQSEGVGHDGREVDNFEHTENGLCKSAARTSRGFDHAARELVEIISGTVSTVDERSEARSIDDVAVTPDNSKQSSNTADTMCVDGSIRHKTVAGESEVPRDNSMDNDARPDSLLCVGETLVDNDVKHDGLDVPLISNPETFGLSTSTRHCRTKAESNQSSSREECTEFLGGDERTSSIMVEGEQLFGEVDKCSDESAKTTAKRSETFPSKDQSNTKCQGSRKSAKIHKCPICRKKLVTKTSLETHVRVQHGDKRQRIPCVQCGNTFSSKSSLQKHVRMIHDGVKAFLCPEPRCMYTCKSRSILAPHVANVHRNLKMFRCHMCERSHRTQESLLGHLKRDHKVYHLSIPCIMCAKTCSSRMALRIHCREVHPGAAMPTCGKCPEVFLTEQDRAFHELVCGVTSNHVSARGRKRIVPRGSLAVVAGIVTS